MMDQQNRAELRELRDQIKLSRKRRRLANTEASEAAAKTRLAKQVANQSKFEERKNTVTKQEQYNTAKKETLIAHEQNRKASEEVKHAQINQKLTKITNKTTQLEKMKSGKAKKGQKYSVNQDTRLLKAKEKNVKAKKHLETTKQKAQERDNDETKNVYSEIDNLTSLENMAEIPENDLEMRQNIAEALPMLLKFMSILKETNPQVFAETVAKTLEFLKCTPHEETAFNDNNEEISMEA